MKIKIQAPTASKEYGIRDILAFTQDAIHCHEDEGCVFFLDGKQVSKADVYAAIRIYDDKKLAKKQITHKRIRVSTGATTCGNTYNSIWVKR